MDESARQLSLSFDAVAKALAEWTVARHAEVDPSLAQRYGDKWRQSWVTEVQARVRYLAQAIAVRRPKLFAETAAWSGSAFAARNGGVNDVATSLGCLREVIDAELPEAVVSVALEHVDAGLERLQASISVPTDRLDPKQPHGELALRYLEAILAGRRNDAADLIVTAVESGTSVSEVYSKVLQPAQVEIGWMWHQDEISVADEHFATATTEMVMSMLRPHFTPAPAKGRRVVATSVRGDLHALGVRMVADHFEMAGWDSIHLGANTPNEDVIRSLSDHEADLLAVSVTSMLHLRDVGELIRAVRDNSATAGVKVIVGGVPFGLDADLWQELGADGWAPSAEAAVGVGNGLLDGTAQAP
ncbi:MAG: cobalamin B12-binding domain-containing protein [Planctomycetota bacterium]|jgi:methylmalonyl-CoA mutase cobalamin-binding domain/chain